MSPFASTIELPAASSQTNSSEIDKSLVEHSDGSAGKNPDESSGQSFEDYIKKHADSHLNQLFANYQTQQNKSKTSIKKDSEEADAYLKNVQNVLDECRKQYEKVSGNIDAAYGAILNDFTSNPKFTPTSIVNHSIINKGKGGKKYLINAGGRIMKIPDIMELGQDIKIVLPSNAEYTPKDSQGNIFLDVNYHNANSIVVSKSNTRNSKKMKSNEHEYAQVSAFFSKNYKVLLDKDYSPLKFPTMLTNRSKLFTTSLGENLQKKITELTEQVGDAVNPNLRNVNFLHSTNFSLVGKFPSSTDQEQTSRQQEWNTLRHALSQHTHTMVFVKTSGATYIIYNAQKFPNQSTSILPNSSEAESFVKCSFIKDAPFCLLTAVKLDGDDNDLALTSYSLDEQNRSLVIPNSNKYLFKIGKVDEPLSLLHVKGKISIHDRLHQSLEAHKEEDNNNERQKVISPKDNQHWIHDPVEEIEIFSQNNSCCHADEAEKICKFHAELPIKIDSKNYSGKDIPSKISIPMQRIRGALNQTTEKSLDVVNYILHQHARSAYSTHPDKDKAEMVNIKIDSHSILTTTKRTLAQFPGSYLSVGENFINAHNLVITLRKPLLEMSVNEVIIALKAIDEELIQKSDTDHDDETEYDSVEDSTWKTIGSSPAGTETVFSPKTIVQEDVSNQVLIRYFQNAKLERFGDEAYKIKRLIGILKNTRMHAEYDLSRLTTRDNEPITKASIHYVIDKMRIIHMSRYGIFPKHSDSIGQHIQFQNEMDDTSRTKDPFFVQEIMQAYKALNINPDYY